ncbi:MAG: alpha/beta fold hydrolase [Candidatus Rokubacteria bacterium]|nr:alpha/beta fold hydrolase [Candidatus Rokubacteria bacterium]
MRRGLALALATLVLLAAPRIGRFGSAHLVALDLLAPGWMPTVHSVIRETVAIDRAAADLYRSSGPQRGGLVLVPGLSREGKDHPAFQRVARSLARAGFLVLAPDFPALRAFHVAEADVQAIVQAVQALTAEAGLPIGIVGFSFGAGPALLAAADPAIRDRVDLVGSFGGYWDLANVIGFITTGWYEEDGRRRQVAQQSYNRWKLLAALAPYAAELAERERLQKLVERKLANPEADVSAELGKLGVEGWQLLALVGNRHRDRVAGLLASLTPPIRERIQRLSPAGAISQVKARLLIAHGRDDDSIPYTESLRLARAAPNLGRLVIFEGFTHAFPSEGGWRTRLRQVRDLERLVLLLDNLLAMRRR